MSGDTEDGTKPGGPARGVALALGAYVIWGVVMPVYTKLIAHVPAAEIVCHRIIWSVPCALAVLLLQGRGGRLRSLIRQPRILGTAALSAVLITANWSGYVYAIVSDRALEAALGYYLNPLVNVMLAAVFLRERPTRWQAVAILLAAIGVAVMTSEADGVPWIALVVAGSFGTYGLLRKLMTVEASEGFFLEVTFLLPFALVVLPFLPGGGSAMFAGWGDALLLLAAGPVTAAPLILYASGARRLRYTSLSILQYLVPTFLFLIAVFVFDEPLDLGQLIAFGFIWSGLILYTRTMLRSRRR
jgi:chloramphenicol-sensitive protein RarD